MTQLHGYDSTCGTVVGWKQIVPTATPDVIGSYANGRYANTTVAKEAFPTARHVQYDVNGSRPDADILDVEQGDASPPTAPGWSRSYKGSLPYPGLYCSASLISTVVSTMLDAGFKRDQFLIQSAHYGRGEHICGPSTCGYPQADATQYADHGLKGENTDLSVFSDHFFTAPAPKPDPHYAWFDTTKRILLGGSSEIRLVREYDRLRAVAKPTKGQQSRLRVLRRRLQVAAGRVWAVAHLRPGKPNWAFKHRGFRRQELLRRAQGHRIV